MLINLERSFNSIIIMVTTMMELRFVDLFTTAVVTDTNQTV